jgi:hypothetical protein
VIPASPARPRLSPGLARRLDRLARQAHAFHRFAHHPLCERYASELVPLGRRARVCRGCSLTLAGALVGLALAATRPSPLAGLALVAAATALGAFSLRARVPKLVGRLVPAALLGCALGAGPVAVSATLAVVLAGGLAYRRRGPSRAPCVGCPEAGASVCSGYAPIVRREQAVQRLGGRWIEAERQLPRA